MDDGEIGDFLEVVFFVEGENIFDAVIFYDDAVNYVSNAGMIFENAQPDVIEKFIEVIIFSRTDFEELYLDIFKALLIYQLTFDLGNGGGVHVFSGQQDIEHLGDGPDRGAELDVLHLRKSTQSVFDELFLGVFSIV